MEMFVNVYDCASIYGMWMNIWIVFRLSGGRVRERFDGYRI